MYPGEAEPASPAITCTASPGARRSRKKFTTAIPSTMPSSCASRCSAPSATPRSASTAGAAWRAAASRMLRRVGVPDILEGTVDLIDAADRIVQVRRFDRKEVQFEQRQRRQIGLHLLLERLEQRDALRGAARTLRIANQRVDLCIAIAGPVRERNVLADAGRIVFARDPDLRIGEARIPLD